MTILAVTNAHERPDLLYDQLENYNVSFDGDVIHGVNINAALAPKFEQEREKLDIDFSKLGNVFFVTPAVETKRFGVLQAYMITVMEAMRLNKRFDYILFHTSADLMVRHLANRYVKRFDLGVGASGNIRFRDEAGNLTFDQVNPFWREQVAADPRLHRLASQLGTDVLHKSRQEGSFFKSSMFFEMFFPLLSFRSTEEMLNIDPIYPAEEFVFSLCTEAFCQRHDVRRTQHLIYTSPSAKQIATVEEIDAVRLSSQQWGVKRFPPNRASEQREYVRKILSS
jgi:hypothetical protein